MQTIGRMEYVDLADFNLLKLLAKVDTGAYSCSIHCHHIIEIEENGIKYIEFELLDPSHPEYKNKKIRTKDFTLKKVRSSNGKSEKRYKIICSLKLGNKKFRTEFTLANRKKMKSPLLIGRKALRKRFLVDVSRKFIIG